MRAWLVMLVGAALVLGVEFSEPLVGLALVVIGYGILRDEEPS